jgi:hypothetical protein
MKRLPGGDLANAERPDFPPEPPSDPAAVPAESLALSRAQHARLMAKHVAAHGRYWLGPALGDPHRIATVKT